MRKLQGDWIIGSHDIPPKKSMKMPRAMDPSRPWSRMTTPFRNWEASLQQFRTMDALLENAEKGDKKWLTIAHTHTCTEHCHGELGRPPDFWLSHEVRTRQRETQKVSIGVYVYFIYIYILLVDLCGCWLIQMSGAMEFLHVLVQWWVFPFLPASFPAIIQLARQSSTNHWNMAGNHETRTIQDTSAMFFAADLG